MNQDGMKFGERLAHAWNAFRGKDQQRAAMQPYNIGPSNYTRPDRTRYHFGSERTILASILTKIAMDATSVPIRHVLMDDMDRYIADVNSGLNYCLTTEANIDQTARAFKQDFYMSMLDEGVVAAVPVDTTFDPEVTGSYDIKTMRTAKVAEWFPQHVKLNLYNDRTGMKEDIILPKAQVVIVENPLYAVMNEPISTLKRLIYKMNMMDTLDEKNASSKLDLIIQLPFDLRTEMRRQEAEKRRRDIETQLVDNKLGIAYASSTEKITQLNRTVENKIIDEIEYLTSTLYSQLGLTKEIFDGTADERASMNYFNRTIEPIVSATADEFNRKLLTKTARSKRQRVMYFNSVFKLATVDAMVNAGAQLVTSEIATRNEVRQFFGLKPAEDEQADQLMNPNINPSSELEAVPSQAYPEDAAGEANNVSSIGAIKVSDIL